MGLSKNRDETRLCINCFRKNTPLTSVDSLPRDQGQDTQKIAVNPRCRAGVMSEKGHRTNPLSREGPAARSGDYVCRSNYLNERK
jgi:hypothetical protein